MVFHWSLSDSKSPQVSRTRLRILAVLSNAVIRIVSTRPPTSKSSRPYNNSLLIFKPFYQMTFHWNDSKASQVFRALVSILADISCAVVWMVLILHRIISSSCLFFLTAPGLYLTRLVSSAVRCRLPAVSYFANRLLWVPFSNSPDWRSLVHFQTRRKSRAQAFVRFHAKTNKKIVCLAHPLHSVII